MSGSRAWQGLLGLVLAVVLNGCGGDEGAGSSGGGLTEVDLPIMEVVVETGAGPPRGADLWVANYELSILEHLAGPDSELALLYLAPLRQLSDEPGMTHALLSLEARDVRAGIDAEQAQELLAGDGLVPDSDTYRKMCRSMQVAKVVDASGEIQGFRFQELSPTDAVRTYLAIRQMLEDQWHAEPTEEQVRELFRQKHTKADIEQRWVRAETFMDEVPEPSAAEIAESYQRYKGTLPREFDDPANPFGQGYKYDDRVAVEYAWIDSPRLQRIMRPTERELLDGYEQLRDRLEPIGDSLEPPTFAEARDQVWERVTGRMVENTAWMIQDTLSEASEFATESGALIDSAAALYGDPVDLLKKTVRIDESSTRIELRQLPQLALKAGVSLLIPASWAGSSMTVFLPIGKTPLSRVLAAAAEQNDEPARQWVRFSVARLQALVPLAKQERPVQAGRTEPLDLPGLMNHPVLCRARACAGGRQLALKAIELGRQMLADPKAERISELQDGETFSSGGSQPSRIIWRIVEVRTAGVPETMTAEIRAAITADLKMVAAMKKLEVELSAVESPADMAAFAERYGIEGRTMESFPLYVRRLWRGRQPIPMLLGINWRTGPEVASRALIEVSARLIDESIPSDTYLLAVLPRRRSVVAVRAAAVTEPDEALFPESRKELVAELLYLRRLAYLRKRLDGREILERLAVRWRERIDVGGDR